MYMRNLDLRKEFLIYIEGPYEELCEMEEEIKRNKGIWKLKLTQFYSVYKTHVKDWDKGRARLEFCADGLKYIGHYIDCFIEHMKEHPTHDITCRYKCQFRCCGFWNKEKHAVFEFDTQTLSVIKPTNLNVIL
jgi:hypothetical protein